MIREATLSDIENIIPLTKAFSDAVNLPFDYKSNLNTLKVFINQPEHMLLIDDACTGVIAGSIVPWIGDYSHTMAIEHFWWVDEEARAGGVGKDLLVAFENKARELGASKITMAAFEDSMPEISKFYMKFGYKKMETHFSKEIN